MNESALVQLKIIAERAIRPVRASTAQKRKMGEELLAHLVGVFEEEAARLGDEQATLERTEQRFGDPTELAVRLQESVPAIDSIKWFVERLCFRPGESTPRRALRHAFLIDGLVLAYMLLFRLVRPDEDSGWLLLGSWVLTGWALVAFAFFTARFAVPAGWMRQALHEPAGRSWLAAASAAITSLLLVPGLAYWYFLADAAAGAAELWSMTILSGFKPARKPTTRHGAAFGGVLVLQTTMRLSVRISQWSWPSWLLYGGWVLLAWFLFVVGFTVLADWLRRAVYGPAGRSSLKAIGAVTALGLLVVGLEFVFGLWPDFPPPVGPGIRGMLVWVGLWVCALVSVAHETADRIRYHQDSANLQIA